MGPATIIHRAIKPVEGIAQREKIATGGFNLGNPTFHCFRHPAATIVR